MRVIYVDDEKPALDNFRLTAEHISEITGLNLFQDGSEALEFVKNNIVDVAFLDINMPGIQGLELAKILKSQNEEIRIVFVTAFSEYALEAWNVDATGYLLKPYTISDIRKELNKCTYHKLSSQQVVVKTIPTLSIMVDGKPFHISAVKPRELFALLVDRGESGVTTGEVIASLWPTRINDANTQSLVRMTYKRLSDIFEEAGIDDMIMSVKNRRFLKTELIDCDLYRILNGDKQAAKNYSGQYLQEYSWAEERNAQLYWMLMESK